MLSSLKESSHRLGFPDKVTKMLYLTEADVEQLLTMPLALEAVEKRPSTTSDRERPKIFPDAGCTFLRVLCT